MTPETSHKKKRVLVAMSGGVDSSVAAALLQQQGYEVIGATMQVWDYSETHCEEGLGTCCSHSDVEDARSVADVLQIPFYVLNCEAPFEKTVIKDFVDSYLQGTTPIPCVQCNTHIKFKHLIDKMHELDCDYLATGHYAQVASDPVSGEPSIFTSSDSWKDQTYFLFTIDPKVIPQLLFPVGHLEKPQLRQMAEDFNLPVAQKKDSTGICFVGKSSYVDFINKNSDKSQHTGGSLKLYPEGTLLGEHEGIHQFTYGQRKGLGVSSNEPLYVLKVDAVTGTVWLGAEKYLYQDKLKVVNCNWLGEISDQEELTVKIRFHHKGSVARVTLEGKDLIVHFKEPQRAITPGQAAVFYRGAQLLGGGWIVGALGASVVNDLDKEEPLHWDPPKRDDNSALSTKESQ